MNKSLPSVLMDLPPAAAALIPSALFPFAVPEPPPETNEPSPPEFPRLLRLRDIMAIFGWSERTARRKLGTTLPVIRIDGRLYVHPDDVNALIVNRQLNRIRKEHPSVRGRGQ